MRLVGLLQWYIHIANTVVFIAVILYDIQYSISHLDYSCRLKCLCFLTTANSTYIVARANASGGGLGVGPAIKSSSSEKKRVKPWLANCLYESPHGPSADEPRVVGKNTPSASCPIAKLLVRPMAFAGASAHK